MYFNATPDKVPSLIRGETFDLDPDSASTFGDMLNKQTHAPAHDLLRLIC